LASYERACDLGYDSACLQRDVIEGRPVPGARYWEFEILEVANAPSWIQVGDVCAATVMTGANLVRLRVTCGGRYIYPPTSVIHWRGADAVVDDHTTTQNRDARLIMDAVAGTFLLEDDDAGFLPSIRLRGRLVEGAAPEPAR
jgi:hypothetical protein